MVSNALFRLLEDALLPEKDSDSSFEEILDVLYEHLTEILDRDPEATKAEVVYYVTLVKMSNDFKLRLRKAYEANKQ